MKLLSFGEIIWDAYGDEYTIGGAPLNLAAHFTLQGGRAWLVSAVGRDALGEAALGRIRALDINTEYVSVSDSVPTGRCDVTLGENGIPSYNILENVAYDNIVLPDHLNRNFDVLAFGTLALRGQRNREALERVLRSNSFTEVYTDLNIRPPFYSRESIELCLANATILKVSDEELPAVTRTVFGKEAPLADAYGLIAERYPNVRLILITQGKDGSSCYDCRAKKLYTCESVPVTVVSTVGAGDSYGAAFLAHYLKTRDILAAMNAAAEVSAFVVSRKEAIPDGVDSVSS